jgi:small GTP-binding protein
MFGRRIPCVLVGNANVGKTTFAARICSDQRLASAPSTIGVDYHILRYRNEESGASLDLCLWDTAGMERFESIVCTYFVRAQVAFFFFELDDPASLASIPKWREQFKAHHDSKIPVLAHVLVGTKADLPRRVDARSLEKASRTYAHYYEVCSLQESAADLVLRLQPMLEAIGEAAPTIGAIGDKGGVTIGLGPEPPGGRICCTLL